MGGGDCDVREKRVVEEGPEFSGDEVGVDCSVDEYQVFDEMPVGVRRFYFVKVQALQNSNTNAMIKAEETIKKMNQDQIMIAQKIRDRQMDSDLVTKSKLSWMHYHDSSELTLKWHREKLGILNPSLDKLTFANNAYKGKPVNSCLSVGEVDKQKLSFLMVHGCKNMVDERKLLREVNASQGKDVGMTLDELRAPFEDLEQLFYDNHIEHLEQPFDDNYAVCRTEHRKTDGDARKQAILKDINRHEIIRETAIANAVVNGKLWNSLGSKKAIQKELQELNARSDGVTQSYLQTNAETRKVCKELEKVEKDICSLQKLFTDASRKKDEAYNTILKLKKQYGEKNASYYQYRSLMKKVEVLVKEKDIAALQELSQIQVETFMQQWNNNQNFRNNYKKRVIPSLNNRHLGVDGRMITNQKPEVDTQKVIRPESLSKTRLKWLMKDPEDPFELLS